MLIYFKAFYSDPLIYVSILSPVSPVLITIASQQVLKSFVIFLLTKKTRTVITKVTGSWLHISNSENKTLRRSPDCTVSVDPKVRIKWARGLS